LKLITLSGAPADILTAIDPKELTDYAAGLVFLGIVSRLYPGLTWGDLLNPERLGRSWLARKWDGLKDVAGDIYDAAKTVIGDIKDGLGDVGGSAIRLAADEEVQQAIVRGASAYATGGQSLQAEGVLSSIFGGGNEAGQKQIIEQAGMSYKNLLTEIPREYLYIGGGVLALVLLIMTLRR
jgi:hypothetical protein